MMNFKKYILLLVVVLSITSCEDFLSPEPTAAIIQDDFYTTPAELDLGVVAIMDAIQGINNNSSFSVNRGVMIEFYLAEMLTDNTGTRTPDPDAAGFRQEFANLSVSDNNNISANYYASMYRVIYLSNLILDSIKENGITNLTAEASARFYRAYAYFNLVRFFADPAQDLGVPLVDHVLSEDETNLGFIRASIDEVYDLIIEDLSLAASGLDDSDKNSASKSAAHTLLAKVYLTLEEPDYTAAILNLDQVYGRFSLLDNYADIFGYANELNDEIIYSVGYEQDLSADSQDYSAAFAGADATTGQNYLTQNLQSSLQTNGGANRQLYGSEDDNTKWPLLKHQSISEDLLGGCDWIVLRYADVILMYAEAYMGAEDSLDITRFRWATDYDLIRTRAGLTTVTTITKDELLDERRYEFFGENKRLFDLKRFGVAETVLGEFASASENNFSFSPSEVNLPIPLREINISPKDDSGQPLLIQNTGW